MFLPDVATVRIERPIPSKFSDEDQQKIRQRIEEIQQQNSTGTRDVGGLTCFIPKPPMHWFNCNGNRSAADPDVIKLAYQHYPSTPFVLILAEYDSSHYGGLRVNWKAWILDPSHALDVDRAIWNSLTDWSLLDRIGASRIEAGSGFGRSGQSTD
jgi:hypothetical protein